MKAAEWKRFVRPLLPPERRWEVRQRLVYELPFEWVLSGALAENSGFSKESYIWQVRTPLFVPFQAQDLTWSRRIGGGARSCSVDEPEEIAAAVREALVGQREAETLAWMAAKGKGDRNRSLVETAGYARVILGDVYEALETLRPAVALGTEPDDPDWVGEMVERMRRVCEALEGGGRDQAMTLIRGWRDYTAGCLGLRRD